MEKVLDRIQSKVVWGLGIVTLFFIAFTGFVNFITPQNGSIPGNFICLTEECFSKHRDDAANQIRPHIDKSVENISEFGFWGISRVLSFDINIKPTIKNTEGSRIAFVSCDGRPLKSGDAFPAKSAIRLDALLKDPAVIFDSFVNRCQPGIVFTITSTPPAGSIQPDLAFDYEFQMTRRSRAVVLFVLFAFMFSLLIPAIYEAMGLFLGGWRHIKRRVA